MLPYLDLRMIGFSSVIPTSLALFAIAVIATALFLSLGFSRLRSSSSASIPGWKGVAITLLVTAIAVIGGRLMHVYWERPDHFAEHPEEILTRFDGMVFYGAFISGSIATWGLLRLWIPREHRAQAWDLIAIGTAFASGLLRLGCFAEGCCWGNVCFMPWSVRFTSPDSVMPFIGIPVHPVQLYDAAAGFSLAALLSYFRRKEALPRGSLIGAFAIGYGTLRFITEFFRGDSMRGVDLWLGLSTSQWISVVLVSTALLFALVKRNPLASRSSLHALASGSARASAALVALLVLAGCLPQPPDARTIRARQRLSSDTELVTLSRQGSGRNLLFVASDSEVQKMFEEPMKKAYRTDQPIRLEEISWWQYAPRLKGSYDQVVRIQYNGFSKESFFRALRYLESRGKPYDLLLLTHGVPNHLVTSDTFPLISWTDLGEMKGRLKGLGYVFMQACFGDTLAPDWHAAGARYVISYNGLNRNFFYPEFFLRYLERSNGNVEQAYQLTNARIADHLRRSATYEKIVQAMGMTMDEYLRNAPNPELSIRRSR